LPPADHDLSDVELSTSWTTARRISSGERPAPHPLGDCALPDAAADDGVPVAQRVCGGGLCHSSAAGGIGGVGGGAKGCVERVVFHADALGLCALRSGYAFDGPLPWRGGSFRPWPAVQAQPGDLAICIVAAGLLAVAPVRRRGGGRRQIGRSAGRFWGFGPSDHGKGSAPGVKRRGVCDGGYGGGRSHPIACRVVVPCADEQSHNVLCDLLEADDLPCGPGALLSIPGQGCVWMGNRSCACIAGWDFGGGDWGLAEAALYAGGVVMVCGDAGADDWDYASRRFCARRSLQLPADDWVVCRPDLGGGGSVRRVASPPRVAGRVRHGHSGCFDFVRAHSGLVLAG